MITTLDADTLDIDTLDIDRAYANGAFIAGSEKLPGLWQALAGDYRLGLKTRARLNIPYGTTQRQQFDLFVPDITPAGLMVFVHGGYWLEFGRETWSHLAAGAVARGWACAMPSYTLAPAARLTDMTVELARAITTAASMVAGPVVVTGHSAGGHLAARMACTDMPQGVAERVRRVVPISPLSELAPLARTRMNKTLRLTEAEIAAESPARLQRRTSCAAHVWVGQAERPAFLWQARLLSEAWDCPWTVAADRHHFNVIDDFTEAGSPLMDACLSGLT
ncbi:MAG: alpha/beta hydrolase [Alphaproteobacteria bacterium]